MPDNLLVTVKAALATETAYADDVQALYPLGWLRALVARCEQAEAQLADKSACHTERVEELQAAGANLEEASFRITSLEDDLAALRQRHAEAVEAAFKEALTRVNQPWFPSDDTVHALWLASEARKAVARDNG